MLQDIKKVTQEQMLTAWAIAEAGSARRWKYMKDLLPKITAEKFINKKYNSLSGEDYQNLIKMIKESRAPMLDGLLKISPEWYQGKLPFKEYQNILIMNWPPFVNLADSYKLSDLVSALEQGKMPPDHREFAEQLERLQKNFSLKTMLGTPILVAKDLQGPYYLIEGFTRSITMIMNARRGIFNEEYIPVHLGISDKLSEWYLKDEKYYLQLIA